MQHLLGDAFSPLVVGAVSHSYQSQSTDESLSLSLLQLSDMVYRFLGTYYTSGGNCDVGKGISLEFALFITVFVCGLGVAAFLSLTLVVENDRKVCPILLK